MVICLVVPLMAQPYNYTPTDTDRSNTMERIIDLHADIVIHPDGTVVVTEYFTLYAAGIDIRRGIARNVPEFHVCEDGRKKTTPVNVISLTRNGEASAYHTETSYQSGNRELVIYFGSSDKLLEKGIHQYTLVYETRGHVGFFDDFDELTWNVVGHDWVYSFEHISATLHPPDDSEAIQWWCYTGIHGSTEQACNCNGDKAAPTFTATRVLLPSEGFTISVAFPRDIIQRPPPLTARQQFYEDYGNWLWGGIVLLIVAISQCWMWYKKGRGAKKQLVMPQFSPPNDWSASMVRYLNKRKFDSKTFTSALMQMAVKGGLRVECRPSKQHKKRYYLTPQRKEGLTTTEQRMFDDLFAVKKSGEIGLKEREVSHLSKTYLAAAARTLEKNVTLGSPIDCLYEKNSYYRFISLLLSITLWIAYMFVSNLDAEDGTPFAVVPLALMLFHVIFCSVIGALTEFGASTAAELAGLRMYLGTAEKNWLNKLMPPQQTPEHFEEMLPYAVALDLENEWCDKFHDVLEKFSYVPAWYADSDLSKDLITGFIASSALTTLNSSVVQSGAYNRYSSYSSSSSSSGSSSYSSGSSGGGYSGSGGGGGGGRGW